MITKTTRHESHKKVDKSTRYKQIISILDKLGSATAKEIAVEMYDRGYTGGTERNFSAPRLTELVEKNKVVVVGKKVCGYTGKSVAVYEVVS